MKRHSLLQLLVIPALSLGAVVVHAQGIINTIAGTGISGYSGDGGPAALATFSMPSGVAVNGVTGDVYIADKSNSRIRVINGSTGIVNTFAGNGIFGLSGIGGPALSSSIRMPNSVFFEAGTQDVLYTDWYNDMAFRVAHVSNNNDGECGDGHQGDDDGDDNDDDSHNISMMTPAGICSDPFGNVYIASNGNNKLRMVRHTGVGDMVRTIGNKSGAYGYTGDGGDAKFATFNHITGVIVDPTRPYDLYVSDAYNNVIRKIDLKTMIITTIAGTGTPGYTGDGGLALSATLSNPGNLFIDNMRNLYICDRSNNVIRKMNLQSNIIVTIAGNGTIGFSGDGGIATTAQLNDPEGVWVDNSGNIFIADAGNQRIREIIAPVVTPPVVTSAPFGTSSGTVASPTPIIPGGVRWAATTLNNVSIMQQVKVFPDPSTGIFTVKAPAAISNVLVEVYNVIGQKVYASAASGQQFNIDLTSQPAGIYTLRLNSADGSYVQKISINK